MGKSWTGRDSYIGPPLDDAGKMISIVPVGLNKDPNQVFTVVKNDGEKVIRIQARIGEPFIQKMNMKIFTSA